MLGCGRVGAGEAEAVLTKLGARGEHLLAPYHPVVAISNSTGARRREVGSGVGLGVAQADIHRAIGYSGKYRRLEFVAGECSYCDCRHRRGLGDDLWGTRTLELEFDDAGSNIVESRAPQLGRPAGHCPRPGAEGFMEGDVVAVARMSLLLVHLFGHVLVEEGRASAQKARASSSRASGSKFMKAHWRGRAARRRCVSDDRRQIPRADPSLWRDGSRAVGPTRA